MSNLNLPTYREDCKITIVKYRIAYKKHALKYLVFALTILSIVLVIAIYKNPYLFIFVGLFGIGTLFTLFDFINAYSFKKLKITHDVYLGIVKEGMFEGVVFKLKDGGLTGGIKKEILQQIPINSPVYMIYVGLNKKLMDIVPIQSND